MWESHRNTLALLLFKDQVHNGFQEVVGILLADFKKKQKKKKRKEVFSQALRTCSEKFKERIQIAKTGIEMGSVFSRKIVQSIEPSTCF